MPKTKQPKEVSFQGWARGVNNLAKEYDLPKDALRSALNIDIDSNGNISRRAGYTKRLSITNGHSGYSNGSIFVFVDSDGLNLFYPDSYTKKIIDATINTSLKMAYCDILGYVYFSNGVDSGKISPDGDVSPLGVQVPSSQPTLSTASGGALTSGSYQVVVTNIDSTGQESGAPRAQMIDVEDGGYIGLSNIPQDPNVAYIRVYLSTPNGDVLYYVIDIPYGVTSYNLYSQIRGKALSTQFKETLPAGTILAYRHGHLYSVVDNTIFFSDPLQYGLYTPLNNYFPSFSEEITILLPVEHGIFVVADKTYFLEGKSPENMTIKEVSNYKGVKGTGVVVNSSIFSFEELTLPVAYWFSDNGPMIGLPTGQIIPATDKRLDPGQYAVGATVLREREGIRSLITALRQQSEISKFRVTDSAVAEVRRNGILIG